MDPLERRATRVVATPARKKKPKKTLNQGSSSESEETGKRKRDDQEAMQNMVNSSKRQKRSYEEVMALEMAAARKSNEIIKIIKNRGKFPSPSDIAQGNYGDYADTFELYETQEHKALMEYYKEAREIAEEEKREKIAEMKKNGMDTEEAENATAGYTSIPFKGCLFRVQNPTDEKRGGDPSNPGASRVTKLVWTTEKSNVDDTFSDFSNVDKKNHQLWLSGTDGLEYVGIDTHSNMTIDYQQNLKDDKSIFTIILPQAFLKNKLKVAHPSTEVKKESRVAASLVGISGKLDFQNMLHVRYRLVREAVEKGGFIPFFGVDGELYRLDFSSKNLG